MLISGSLSVLILARWIHSDRSRVYRLAERNTKAVLEGGVVELASRPSVGSRIFLYTLLPIGFTFLIFISYLANSWALNALLDQSQPHRVIGSVTRFEQKIYNGIFRESKIYFKLPHESEEHSAPLRASQQNAPIGPDVEVEIRSGYFGWLWISNLRLL